MIQIADFGAPFGMSVSPVFRPWKGVRYLDTRIGEDRISEVVAQADLVLLGGGGDIHPSLYGCENVASHCYDEPTKRDLFESAVVDASVLASKPILGICRGAQMLCIKAGGKLIQHVDNHAGTDHEIWCPDYFDKPLVVNSVHHQMMVPPHRAFMTIGYSENRTDRFLYDAANMTLEPDYPNHNPEILYFSGLKGLAIQGHPEFIENAMNPFVRFTRDLVQQFFGLTA